MSLTLTSSAFAAGEAIPVEHTGDGEDASPVLAWEGAPDGTKSFALVVDDPDAPTAEPWVHWVVYELPAQAAGLPPGVPPGGTVAGGGRQGINDFGNLGYGGPAPPPGRVHRYRFRLYALDTVLGLPAGARKAEVLAASREHRLATAELVGTYAR